LAIHLSDNGIRADVELMGELLDMFGQTEEIFKIINDDNFQINQRIKRPERLREVLKQHTMSLRSLTNNAQSDANMYTNRLLHTKQGKTVCHNRLQNQA